MIRHFSNRGFEVDVQEEEEEEEEVAGAKGGGITGTGGGEHNRSEGPGSAVTAVVVDTTLGLV